MKIEMDEQELNNLYVFLDRVEYKGFNEIDAINKILNCLTIAENNENKVKKVVNK